MPARGVAGICAISTRQLGGTSKLKLLEPYGRRMLEAFMDAAYIQILE